MSRRVFDVFMFNDELDILECRLTELDNADVTHVLIEATMNLQGRPKPLYYADNKARFSRWEDKITHVIVDDLDPDDNSAWGRDHAQRENGWRGLSDADPDDVVIHSDCDEILREEAVEHARGLSSGQRYQLRHFIFACDWEAVGGQPWDKPAATLVKNLGSITALRGNCDFPTVIRDMGWHLSFLGGPEGIRRKMQGDCHPEVRAEVLRMNDEGLCYQRGMFWQSPHQLTPVDADETWPRYIREGRAPAIWYRPR